MRLKFNRGFGATVAVMLMSLGAFALAISAFGAAVTYSDSIEKSKLRLQSALNKKACDDLAILIRAKDLFASGIVEMPEFGCEIQF